MPKVTQRKLANSKPVWMSDYPDSEKFYQDGAVIRTSTITAVNNIKQVPSGSLVGRFAGSNQFSLVPPNATALTGTLPTVLTADAASGATVISVANVDGYGTTAPLNAITIGAATATITAVDKINNTLTLSAGLAAAVTAGTAVRLTTAQPYTDLALVGVAVVDADSNPETMLYRPFNGIYLNLLPGYATFTQVVRDAITSKYVVQLGLY